MLNPIYPEVQNLTVPEALKIFFEGGLNIALSFLVTLRQRFNFVLKFL